MSVVPPAENDADHSIEDNVQNEIPDAIRASDIEENRPNQSEQDKSCDTDDDEDKRLEQENDTKEGSPQLSEEGAEIAAPVADKKKDRPPQEQDTSDSSTGTSDPQPLESTAAQRQREHNPASGNVEERISHSHSRRAFISGMAFILSVFISYYLLGFGLFTAISSTNVSGAILLALGIFVIVLGVWNIKDFLCYDKGYNVEIPRSWRPLLKRILGAVSSPVGALLAGFIVCLFELPCTGGPYLFILGLLGDQNTRSEAAFLLLYYNFIFVLPLIVINCLVFWGASMLEAVGSWKDKYIRYLHLFAGIVLIGLGALAVADSQKSIF
jgi:cytochrome c biogenesis protein CcdA